MFFFIYLTNGSILIGCNFITKSEKNNNGVIFVIKRTRFQHKKFRCKDMNSELY